MAAATITANITRSNAYGFGLPSQVLSANQQVYALDVTVPAEMLARDPQIFFAVDVSGSMTDVMDQVRASLLAFQQATAGADEAKFREAFRTVVYTFSTNVERVYPAANGDQTFSQVVNELQAGGMTNLSGALESIYAEIGAGNVRPTIVVVLSDGQPNEGARRTAADFGRLPIPPNTHVIAVGYTKSCDAPVLSAIGDFNYIDNIERIVPIIGTVLGLLRTFVTADIWVEGDYQDDLRVIYGARRVEDRRFYLGLATAGETLRVGFVGTGSHEGTVRVGYRYNGATLTTDSLSLSGPLTPLIVEHNKAYIRDFVIRRKMLLLNHPSRETVLSVREVCPALRLVDASAAADLEQLCREAESGRVDFHRGYSSAAPDYTQAQSGAQHVAQAAVAAAYMRMPMPARVAPAPATHVPLFSPRRP